MADVAVLGFYTVAWHKSCLYGKRRAEHAKTLKEDIQSAFQDHHVDVMLLLECGEIEQGSGEEFENFLRSICGSDFTVVYQRHYACIIRTSRIDVTNKAIVDKWFLHQVIRFRSLVLRKELCVRL